MREKNVYSFSIAAKKEIAIKSGKRKEEERKGEKQRAKRIKKSSKPPPVLCGGNRVGGNMGKAKRRLL